MMAFTRQARLICPTREEIDQLLLECRPDTYPGVRDYTIIQLVINTGISPTDMAAMRIGDIVLEGLKLDRGLCLPLIGTRIRTVIGTYLDVRKDVLSENDFLFVNGQTVSPLTGREIGHIVARRCRQACLDLPHAYDGLRFYFVQRWIRLGGSPEALRVVFEDALGRRRLPLMISPGPRLPAKQKRFRRCAQLKDQVVRWYVEQGMSFKRIYAEYGVTEKMARACLKMAGQKARNVSQAARMRYTIKPDSSPVARRLTRLGRRVWQQEQRFGIEVLKLLADEGRISLADLTHFGLNRRQCAHARKWLAERAFATYTRSRISSLTITEKGLAYLKSLGGHDRFQTATESDRTPSPLSEEAT